MALAREYKNKTMRNDMNYNMMSIALPLERFFSLTLSEQEQHIQTAKTHKPKYIWQHKQNEYFTDQFRLYIDYNDWHSGTSYGYCVGNVSKYIMGTKQEKLEQWSLLIKAYITPRIVVYPEDW